MTRLLNVSSALLALLVTAAPTRCRAQGGGPVDVGQRGCVEGFVMDYFCIQRGTLLDEPSVRTLEGPEEHSVHCLIDVGVCNSSPYEILIDPGPGETLYARGWRLDKDTKAMITESAVQNGICTLCAPENAGVSKVAKLRKGFRVAMDVTVLALGSDSTPPTIGRATKITVTTQNDNICGDNLLRASVEATPNPTKAPVALATTAPSPAPTPVPVPLTGSPTNAPTTQVPSTPNPATSNSSAPMTPPTPLSTPVPNTATPVTSPSRTPMLPTAQGTARPSLDTMQGEVVTANSSLSMVLNGLFRNLDTAEIAEWEELTSRHVKDFWSNRGARYITVESVNTTLLLQERLSSASNLPGEGGRNLQGQGEDFTILPLRIVYDQSIVFRGAVDQSDGSVSQFASPQGRQLMFALPFSTEVHQNNYTEQIGLLTNNPPSSLAMNDVEVLDDEGVASIIGAWAMKSSVTSALKATTSAGWLRRFSATTGVVIALFWFLVG